MTVAGPSFLALQVLDIERAADFYETQLGLQRAPQAPPGAVVFLTEPIPFAVREPLPGVDLESAPRPGLGVALWMSCDAVQRLHDDLVSKGTPIVRAPEHGPFGLNFTFADPDGYEVTVHEQASDG